MKTKNTIIGNSHSATVRTNPFAAISKGGWFDDPRSAHEISDELYSGRINTRHFSRIPGLKIRDWETVEKK